MDWPEIAFSVVFGVAMIVFFAIAAKRGERMLAEQAGKVNNAQPAEAKILAYEEGFFGGRDGKGRFDGVRFELEVTLPGQLPYQATTFWKVYPMAVPKVQAGQKVAVKVDAADSQIVYPNLESVEYNHSAAIWQQKQS